MALHIFHDKRNRPFKIGEGYHITFQRRELPDAGAMQYAYETFGLPAYSAIGPTVRVHKPPVPSQPASYVLQAVGLVGMPPTSVLQGQNAMQPLMDPYTANSLGLGAPPNATPQLAQFNVINPKPGANAIQT